MQALTEMLRDMRLAGGLFLDARFSAPWSILSQVEESDCTPHMPMPRHLIAYHYVVEGDCLLRIDGEEPLAVSGSQLIVLPRNEPHYLASEPGLAPVVDVSGLVEYDENEGIGRIRHGGGGAGTRILCGFLGSDRGCAPLLSSLPSAFTLKLDAGRSGAWFEQSIRYAMRQLATGGSAAAASLARLAELLLVEAVREYIDQLPSGERGFLAGLGDPVVGRSLACLHQRLDREWSLDELAREVGTSRSVLTERFARYLGSAPMEYLRHRRLERAADQLTATGKPVATIACEVGYGSEAAFSRSFRRAYGCSPGAFRKATR